MKHFGIVSPQIEDYMLGLTPQSEGVLADIEAHAARENVPIIGPLQGQLLYTLALALKSKNILDVGTAIGYSAFWLGLAAQRNEGRVVTIEKDPARAAWAEAYFRQAEMSGICAVRRGDALTLMRGMDEGFDLIFLDVLTQFSNSETALQLLDLCVTRLRPSGILLSDNAFRGGAVLDPASAHPSTQGIDAFNRAITSHPRLVSSFIPMRDGISISIKVA